MSNYNTQNKNTSNLTPKRIEIFKSLFPGRYDTDKRDTVFEHRLIMAKHLGRCLQVWKWVNYKNSVKDDNSLSNLQLATSGSLSLEQSKGYRDGYQKEYQEESHLALKRGLNV
ncbi:hypothetical protein ACFLWR_01460 [Chloroflexota bacterium]